MFVCRPRLPDPIRHNLCATCSFVRRLQTFLVSSALFARMQCTGCSARSRTRSGPAGRRPVGQQAGKFCRTFDIHRTCGVRLPRPFAFVASHIPDRYQARPGWERVDDSLAASSVHRSTSDFTRSSQARPLARRPREVPFACQALLGLLLPALERLGSINRLVEHGNDLPIIVL
jgi:hypothetical protein